MISNIMKDIVSGSDNESNKNQISLPRDVKEAVRKCRESTQEALKSRCSRMDIEFPVGTKFGVEKGTTSSKRKGDIMSLWEGLRILLYAADIFCDMLLG